MGHEGFETGGCFQCSGILLIGVATTFLCFSVSTTPDWVSGQVYGRELRLGLWSACLDAQCTSLHADGGVIIATLGSWIEFCEAFACIGIALWCGAILATGTYLLLTNREILRLGAYILFLASVSYSACLVLYAAECASLGLVPAPLHLSSALYCGAAGVVGGVLTAGCFLLDYYKNTRERHGYSRIN